MESKHSRSTSQQSLLLPKLLPKVRIGPTTMISPPLSFRASETLVSRSSLEIHTKLPTEAKPTQSFIDQLILKYTSSRNIETIDLTSKVQKFENLNFAWSMKTTYGNVPSSRVFASLTQIGSNFYLFGGQAGDRLSDLRSFNYEKLTWKPICTFKELEAPEARDGHTALPYKNFLVVYGGAGGYNNILHTRTCSPLVHLLDLQSLNWKVFRPEGRTPEPRRNHSAAIVGCSMIVYGGINNNSDTLADLHLVNLEQMQWTPVRLKKESVRPGARHSFTMTCAYSANVFKNSSSEIYNMPGNYDDDFTKKNSGVYLFGGMNEAGKVLNDLFLIQAIKRVSRTDKNLLKIIKIEGLGQSPIPRYGHSAGLCGKLVVIVGGRNDSLFSSSSQASVSEIAAFNVVSWRWENIDVTGNIPPAFWGIAAGSCNSKLLCFGGMNLNSFASNDLWVLETCTDSFERTVDKRRDAIRRVPGKKMTSKSGLMN